MKRVHKPYRNLGDMLKSFREDKKQSIPEVSGAVEIEVQTLEKIETGEQRPAEEILALLISYFDIREEEATKLWELAGYNDVLDNSSQTTYDLNQQVAMVLPMDLRVVYTDMVHVMINDFGVVMNFMQGNGPKNQPLAVARIGMSHEHAKSVMDILAKSLDQAKQNKKPRLLKSPKQRKPGQSENKKSSS